MSDDSDEDLLCLHGQGKQKASAHGAAKRKAPPSDLSKQTTVLLDSDDEFLGGQKKDKADEVRDATEDFILDDNQDETGMHI